MRCARVSASKSGGFDIPAGRCTSSRGAEAALLEARRGLGCISHARVLGHSQPPVCLFAMILAGRAGDAGAHVFAVLAADHGLLVGVTGGCEDNSHGADVLPSFRSSSSLAICAAIARSSCSCSDIDAGRAGDRAAQREQRCALLPLEATGRSLGPVLHAQGWALRPRSAQSNVRQWCTIKGAPIPYRIYLIRIYTGTSA